MVNVAVKRHDNSVYLSLTQNVPDSTGPRPGKGTQCLRSYAFTPFERQRVGEVEALCKIKKYMLGNCKSIKSVLL